MRMAKPSERDIDAAGEAMSVLNDISSGYFPSSDGDDEQTPSRFDEDDPEHLRRFYELMKASLDASPGWQNRVIGGMCYVILYGANRIVDPKSDTLELHPRFAGIDGAVAALTESAKQHRLRGDEAQAQACELAVKTLRGADAGNAKEGHDAHC